MEVDRQAIDDSTYSSAVAVREQLTINYTYSALPYECGQILHPFTVHMTFGLLEACPCSPLWSHYNHDMPRLVKP